MVGGETTHRFYQYWAPMLHLCNACWCSLLMMEHNLQVQNSNYMKNNDIKHLTSSPYHPSSIGLAERAVQCFKENMNTLSIGNLLETRVPIFLFWNHLNSGFYHQQSYFREEFLTPSWTSSNHNYLHAYKKNKPHKRIIMIPTQNWGNFKSVIQCLSRTFPQENNGWLVQWWKWKVLHLIMFLCQMG